MLFHSVEGRCTQETLTSNTTKTHLLWALDIDLETKLRASFSLTMPTAPMQSVAMNSEWRLEFHDDNPVAMMQCELIVESIMSSGPNYVVTFRGQELPLLVKGSDAPDLVSFAVHFDEVLWVAMLATT